LKKQLKDQISLFPKMLSSPLSLTASDLSRVKSIRSTKNEAPRILRAKEFLLSIPLGTQPPSITNVFTQQSLPVIAISPTGSSTAAAAVITIGAGVGVGITTTTTSQSDQDSSNILNPSIDASSPIATTTTTAAASLLATNKTSIQALESLTVRLPGEKFRHITSRGQRSAIAFREALIREAVVDARIMFASNKQYPSLVFSVIRYDLAAETALARTRLAAANRLFGDAVEVETGAVVDGAGGVSIAGTAGAATWKERSHSRLLFPEFAVPEAFGKKQIDTNFDSLTQGTAGANSNLTNGISLNQNETRDRDEAAVLNREREPGIFSNYRPTQLDDPAIDLESQRKSYERDGYSMSVLAFQTEQAAKQEINAKFAVVNPWLDCQSLTLSKIRSLKKRAIDAWWENGWEMSTVALAFVYFEALVYRGLVNKGNRKLAMATCLLIAFKASEAKEGGGQEAGIEARAVVAELELKFEVTRAAVLKAEFPIFKHLGFSLNIPTHLVAPHLERILQSKGTNPLDYLGQDLHRRYAILTATGGRLGVLDQYAPDFSLEDRQILVSLALGR
jgi:hypothetical protein